MWHKNILFSVSFCNSLFSFFQRTETDENMDETTSNIPFYKHQEFLMNEILLEAARQEC